MAQANTTRRVPNSAATLDPRELVQSLPTWALAAATVPTDPVIGGVDPMHMVLLGDETLFTCPECQHEDASAPSAVLLDPWRWRCTACGIRSTRYRLETLVLDDEDWLTRAYELGGAHV